MTYWDADMLQGGDIERSYGRWEGHQAEWHDRMELGDRAAEALIEAALIEAAP